MLFKSVTETPLYDYLVKTAPLTEADYFKVFPDGDKKLMFQILDKRFNLSFKYRNPWISQDNFWRSQLHSDFHEKVHVQRRMPQLV